MKFNPLYGLIGGCLIGGVLVGALTLTPLAANADLITADGTIAHFPQPETTIAEATPESLAPALPVLAALDQLNLTTDQEAQLAALRRETRSQLEAVIQPEQRQQFKTTWQQGGSFRQAIAAMNLTSDQQQQVRSIFQSARQQGTSILTVSQRQELRQLIQERLDRAL